MVKHSLSYMFRVADLEVGALLAIQKQGIGNKKVIEQTIEAFSKKVSSLEKILAAHGKIKGSNMAWLK